jgi:hypothetical protein
LAFSFSFVPLDSLLPPLGGLRAAPAAAAADEDDHDEEPLLEGDVGAAVPFVDVAFFGGELALAAAAAVVVAVSGAARYLAADLAWLPELFDPVVPIPPS